eukprot:2885328-Prymnesium_polylepis.1
MLRLTSGLHSRADIRDDICTGRHPCGLDGPTGTVPGCRPVNEDPRSVGAKTWRRQGFPVFRTIRTLVTPRAVP